MEKVIDFLVGNPVVLVIAVIISLAILFSFMKRIVRVFLVAAAAAVLYIAYLTWSGGNISEPFRKAEKVFQDTVKKGSGVLELLQKLLKSGDQPSDRPV